MRLPAIRIPALIPLLLASAAVLPAAQFVLVLHSSDGSWRVQDAEKISFNQEEKLRVGVADKPDVRPEEYKNYKRLDPKQDLQAGVVRKVAGDGAGFLYRKSGGGAWEPVLPDGLKLKTASTVAAVWSAATVSFLEDKKAKGPTVVPAAKLFAVLPGGDRNEAVVGFLLEAGNFHGVGERDEAASFRERMSLLAGVARSITGPAAEKLRLFLISEMDSRNRSLSAGSAHMVELDRGLQYADVSELAYPGDDRQKKLRDALREKKAWVDRQVAILKALAAGGLWDPLIEKYGDFERWDNSFEDLHKLWQTAFVRSAEEHLSAANRLRAKQPCLARQELDTVLKLSPDNREARVLLDDVISECENLGGRSCGKAEDPKAPEYRTVTRFLADAESYANNKRFDDAEASLASAESRAKDSPRVLFARANLFDLRAKPLKALAVLDQYMSCVSGPDAEKGETLRTRIKITLEENKRTLKEAVLKSEAAGDYVEALRTLNQALALDENDPDFLYRAGIESAINRKYADAERFLTQVLRRPASRTGSRRSEVIDLLPKVRPPADKPEGAPNWFSGYRSLPGIFYDPLSLAPNVRIAEVRGARKMVATWQWAGSQLSSVQTVIQEPGENGFSAWFDYFKDGGVRRVDKAQFDSRKDPPIPSFTPAGAVSEAQGSFVVLANYPEIDPLMVSRLLKKDVAVVVTGNPYFNPFAWSAICRFLVQYDDRKRIVTAREIVPEGQAPRTLDFKWDDLRLTAIVERGGAGYRRDMTYRGGKLIGETVSFRGKNSKIEYRYTGDSLTSAHCDDDLSLDTPGRSRDVRFH